VKQTRLIRWASSVWAGSARYTPTCSPRCQASSWQRFARAGQIGSRKWRPLRRARPLHRLPPNARRRELDALSIVTHYYDHCQIAVDALRAGKNVLLEKPMASCAAECDQIVEAARGVEGC